jgi:uncharacterized membrane protein (Fun14 family)
MTTDTLLSTVMPFAGSMGLGYAMGFALKKILKWVLIIVGFLAGVFLIGIQLLHKYNYVGAVNWDKLGNDTSVQVQHWGSNVDFSNAHSVFNTLGIPVTSGLGIGLVAGFVRTH